MDSESWGPRGRDGTERRKEGGVGADIRPGSQAERRPGALDSRKNGRQGKSLRNGAADLSLEGGAAHVPP